MNDILIEDLARIHAGLSSRDKLNDATVVVTGCGGFLGYLVLQYLARYSSELGVRRVIGLDSFLLEGPVWLEQLARANPNLLQIETFDIARGALSRISGADQATHVIHMASVASPAFYRRYPLETIDANVWGLRALLEFYRDSPFLKGLLFFSSSEIYGDPDASHIPTAEEYRGNVPCLGPRACYDESKRFGETLCQIFYQVQGLPIRIVRPFNNFGPGMRITDRRLPADFARSVLEGTDIVMHSDGSPTRTFCYAADAVTGYLLCMLHDQFGAFNIGTDAPEISVRAFAEIFRSAGAKLSGYSGQILCQPSRDPDYLTHNPNRRCPIIRKAREELCYEPVVRVDDGVTRWLRFLLCERD